MKLSVVIVNYNVEHFLEQCLNSVLIAAEKVDTEIIVVDNNSVDGSLKMLHQKFPNIHLIANKENLGFSKANNQAIRIAKGEYVLLLNPDTIVEADTFKKVVDFMDSHPEAGGLGVKMLDGKGNFLPESKRGLPTPAAAFFKMFGFSKIFPKSKIFSKYHLGYLDKDETHEIEVLSGAFMLMRKTALDKVGLLDEDFFMYGEDIDLSFRILQGGFKNFYYPETRIIHYKGESTKKDTVNYVYVFYNAMVIFARKHFSKNNADIFAFLINTAIIFRAMISLVYGFIKRSFLPLADFILTYSGILLLANYWGPHYAFQSHGYPKEFLFVLLPIFTFILLISTFYSGGYDKPVKIQRLLKGQVLGALLIVLVYSFLPEHYRFSRATILFIAFWGPIITLIFRFSLNFLNLKSYKFESAVAKRFGIVGDVDEIERTEKILKESGVQIDFSMWIFPNKTENFPENFIGNISQIPELVKVYKLNELIFCAKNVESQQIIQNMVELQQFQLDYKIVPPESMFIIGSNSINTSSDIYFIDLNAINRVENKRFKRLFDLVFSIILLIFSPLIYWFLQNKKNYFTNLLKVILGKFSIVGFDEIIQKEKSNWPSLKKGILHPSDTVSTYNPKQIEQMNILYAKEYKTLNDFTILRKAFMYLGRKV